MPEELLQRKLAVESKPRRKSLALNREDRSPNSPGLKASWCISLLELS
jgi:hypothetical protein